MKLISIEELKAFLQSNNFTFIASQPKLCLPIIQRIHYKMKLGMDFENINVDGSLIINGHHRYICSLLAGKEVKTNPWKSPSNIKQCEWTAVEIDANDWETKYTIGEHNKKDAQRIGQKVEIFDILIQNSPDNA